MNPNITLNANINWTGLSGALKGRFDSLYASYAEFTQLKADFAQVKNLSTNQFFLDKNRVRWGTVITSINGFRLKADPATGIVSGDIYVGTATGLMFG